ncbi:hypothetical protein IDH44_14680 [Paenibacillus sp. IB182496]|uniref:Copper amine oxidase-like N-terminal domain-containing protein n=1 Tax=Paenibacillus sabuli TaxID=2772509 RepID=A0A927BVW9_9BACL|nr:hypothetical protein [Paenibacillus sabuli]MBD2846444.1 hypothetical protein [Paenibacillus sabuli]
MKQFILGLVLGAILFTAFSVSAEEIKSLVGKKIQGEVRVEFQNQYLMNDGIVINGVSYLPIRELSEILNFSITYRNKTVTINKAEGDVMEEPGFNSASSDMVDLVIDSKRRELNALKSELQSKEYLIQQSIKDSDLILQMHEGPIEIQHFKDTQRYFEEMAEIEQLETEIATLEQEIKDLEEQKEEF